MSADEAKFEIERMMYLDREGRQFVRKISGETVEVLFYEVDRHFQPCVVMCVVSPWTEDGGKTPFYYRTSVRNLRLSYDPLYDV